MNSKNGTTRNSFKSDLNNNHLKKKEKHLTIKAESNHSSLNDNKLTPIKTHERLNTDKLIIKNKDKNSNNKTLQKSNSKNNFLTPKKLFNKQLSKFSNTIKKISYEEMKKQINDILNETNEKITSLTISFSQIDINAENSYSKIQEEYSRDLEELYKERIKNIKEINEKYDFVIYEKKKDYREDDPIILEINNKREEEFKKILEKFNKKKEEIKDNYEKQIRETKENCIQQRKILFNNTIYEEIKEKIINVLNNTNSTDNPSLKKSSTTRNLFNKPINKLLSINGKLKSKI